MRVEKEPEKVYYTTHNMIGDGMGIAIIEHDDEVYAQQIDCPRKVLCYGNSVGDVILILNKLGYRNLKRISITTSVTTKLARDGKEEKDYTVQ